MPIEVNKQQSLEVITPYVQPSGKLWLKMSSRKLRQGEQPIVGFIAEKKQEPETRGQIMIGGIFPVFALPVFGEIEGARIQINKVHDPDYLEKFRAKFEFPMPISPFQAYADSRAKVALGGMHLGERIKKQGLTAFIPEESVSWQRADDLLQYSRKAEPNVSFEGWPRLVLEDPYQVFLGRSKRISEIFLGNEGSRVWWEISKQTLYQDHFYVRTRYETPMPSRAEHFDEESGKLLDPYDFREKDKVCLDISSFKRPHWVAELPPIIKENFYTNEGQLIITDGYRPEDFEFYFPAITPRSEALEQTEYFRLKEAQPLEGPVIIPVRNRAGYAQDELYMAQLPYLSDSAAADLLKDPIRGYWFNNYRATLMNYLALKQASPEIDPTEIQLACKKQIEGMKRELGEFGVDSQRTVKLEALLRQHSLLP